MSLRELKELVTANPNLQIHKKMDSVVVWSLPMLSSPKSSVSSAPLRRRRVVYSGSRLAGQIGELSKQVAALTARVLGGDGESPSRQDSGSDGGHRPEPPAPPRRVLKLSDNRLLNHAPERYFGRPVPWPAPAQVLPAAFMTRCGFPDLAPYSERIRVLTCGKVFVKAASGVWCEIISVRADWSRLHAPLRQVNRPRLSEVTDPDLLAFLEALQ